jgi:predicted esterase
MGDGVMKSIYKFTIIVIIVICTIMTAVACNGQAPAQKGDKVYTYTSTPDDKDNFSYGQFSIWCPENIKTYRGILYLGAGYEYSSVPMMNEKKWQDIARENEFILLTSHMKSRTESGTEIAYWQAEYGSGQELLDALSFFAKEAKHPEIEHAPLAMWGFSAGAQFNYHFACLKPERVITFIAIKGGYYFSEPNNETLKIPALFFTGEYDLQRRKDAVDELFNKNIKNELLWCMADEPASGHEIGRTEKLAIPWLNEIIKQRLPKEENASKGPIALKDINQSLVWVGDRTDGNIVPFSDYKKDRKNVSWLPNENLAKIWKDFHLHQ